MILAEQVAGFDGRKLVFGGVFAVANRLQRLLDARLPELTARQWWTLVILELFDDPPTLTQLAQAMDTSHQSVKGIVKHLEAGGFVELIPDPKDARAQRINPTAKVAQWSEETAAQQQAFMDAMFAGMSDAEATTLGESLLKVHAALGVLEDEKGTSR
jgi:DNA-binding MarR family transcriptional regulator